MSVPDFPPAFPRKPRGGSRRGPAVGDDDPVAAEAGDTGGEVDDHRDAGPGGGRPGGGAAGRGGRRGGEGADGDAVVHGVGGGEAERRAFRGRAAARDCERAGGTARRSAPSCVARPNGRGFKILANICISALKDRGPMEGDCLP